MSEKKDLQVLAQEFGLKHKLRNYISPKGLQRAITEGVSSKYQDRMEVLREADSSMRESAVLFKDYLKSAQKAFKDNRYLDVAHWCSMVNDGVKLMMRDAKPVVDLRDAEIAEYYTRHEDANPEHNYFSADDGLVSTAGLLDRLFGNSIEKLYWKKVRESKLAVQSLISRTEKLIAISYSSLDRMGNARAHGNIGNWLEDVQRIGKAQGEFQIFAKGVYDKHLKELADIVKANKQQAPVQTQPISVPSQNAPQEIPTVDKADEAEELIDNEPFELINKKEVEPVKEEKFERGRPALNDPRNVQKQNEKELEEWSKVQDLLKGNVQVPEKVEEVKPVIPEVKPVEEKVESISEPNKIENKVETPKVVESPVVAPIAKPIEAPKPVEVPKAIETPKAVIPQVSAPKVPQAPTQTTVQEAPKRGRGRPRKHPLPTANVQQTAPSNIPAPTVQVPTQETDTNPFSSGPVEVPSISSSNIPKEAPVHVDIKGKNPEVTPPNKELEGVGKKVTIVLLPKIHPEPNQLTTLKDKLEQQLGHPIRFVTKANGTNITKTLKDAGYELDAIIYDDAVKEAEKAKLDPLTLLDDPEFLKTLPTLGNGDFHKGSIIDEDAFPAFKDLDKGTRKAVIDKLNKLDSEKSKTPQNVEKSVATPKLEKPINKIPEMPEEVQMAPPEKSEDELEQETFMHTGLIEKVLSKSMKDLTAQDVFQLLGNKEYLDSLPRNKQDNGKTFDMKSILEFPEVKILKNEANAQGYDPSKMFLSTLKGFETGKIPYPKTKAANFIDDMLIKVANKKFFIELEKVAKTQNKGLMAALMCKYSEEIETVDPIMSAKLLIQAEKLFD